MFVGQPAWHGLGTVLDHPPTTREAIVAAKMDLVNHVEPLFYADKLSGQAKTVPNRAVVREDGVYLGTVGAEYEVLQNHEAFAWFDPVLEAGLATIEAAGTLRGGRVVWVLAKNKGVGFSVVKGDDVEQYLLLVHAHDGTMAITCGFTNVRVVCWNTLSAALREAERLLKFRHSRNCRVNLEKARDTFTLAASQFNRTCESYQFLAKVKCDDKTARRYFREVFAPGRADDEKAATVTVNRIFPLFEGGVGRELAPGTMWNAFNAITQFNTHNRSRTADARLEGQWLGKSAKDTNRALDVALQFAKQAA